MAGERGGRQNREFLLLLPEPVRTLPADLVAVVVLVLAACLAVLVPGLNETPLRVALGLPLVLFLPGYALVAALFPEGGESPTAESPVSESDETSGFATGASRGIDGVERVALSLGLSIAVVPLVGLLLNFTPWGIRLVPVLFGLTAVTLSLTAVAAARRRALPESERFRVPYRDWVDVGRREVFEPETQLDGLLNVVLAVSILLALGAVGYAVVVPPQGETFTEFYVLTEDEDDDRVAADYPTAFEVGDSEPVVLGIGNQEGEAVSYTVVVQLQEVEVAGNETTVLERQELDRFSAPELAANETWHHDYDIQPTMTGEDLRLQFLLYRGEPPASPTEENAYRDIYLWIDVGG